MDKPTHHFQYEQMDDQLWFVYENSLGGTGSIFSEKIAECTKEADAFRIVNALNKAHGWLIK